MRIWGIPCSVYTCKEGLIQTVCPFASCPLYESWKADLLEAPTQILKPAKSGNFNFGSSEINAVLPLRCLARKIFSKCYVTAFAKKKSLKYVWTFIVGQMGRVYEDPKLHTQFGAEMSWKKHPCRRPWRCEVNVTSEDENWMELA